MIDLGLAKNMPTVIVFERCLEDKQPIALDCLRTDIDNLAANEKCQHKTEFGLLTHLRYVGLIFSGNLVLLISSEMIDDIVGFNEIQVFRKGPTNKNIGEFVSERIDAGPKAALEIPEDTSVEIHGVDKYWQSIENMKELVLRSNGLDRRIGGKLFK